MTSKWVDDIQTILWRDWGEDGIPWGDIYDRLMIIDKLLRKAMHSTDDENFSDEIKKQIENIATGTSRLEGIVEDNFGEFEGETDDGKV